MCERGKGEVRKYGGVGALGWQAVVMDRVRKGSRKWRERWCCG